MSLQFLARVALAGVLWAGAAYGQSYVVSRAAGTAMPPVASVAPTKLSLYSTAVALDGGGNLYIASYYMHAVYKFSAAGVLSVVAGTGVAGFSGDGGPASAAQLSSPGALAVDNSGNLFIGDSGRVRKVSSNGIIVTVAGGGSDAAAGFSVTALAVDAAGDLFLADGPSLRIREVTADGIVHTIAGTGTMDVTGDGGPAIEAAIGQPNAICLDGAGNVYFAAAIPLYPGIQNLGKAFVRRISPNGIITNFAGNGTVGTAGDGGPATAAQLSSVESLATDSAGNVYIGDPGRIRRVSLDGTISTVAGTLVNGSADDGIPATQASIGADGLAVGADGAFYFSEGTRVRKVSNGLVSTLIGNRYMSFSGDGGAATLAQFDGAAGVAVDSAGSLYISDNTNGRIRKVSPDGTISTMAGNGSFGVARDGTPALAAPWSNRWARWRSMAAETCTR